MKKLLCRHRDKNMFEKLGFGIIVEDFGGNQVLVEWLLTKRNHFIVKRYLYILDENEIDGYRS
jgi:hypothetical protein|tara:strand:- start:417 stop:605 length:189 start_codon:yes stop_codon:yes gene_type:complete